MTQPTQPDQGIAPVPTTVTELATALGFHGALEGADAVAVPRARLAQGLTPEVLEGTVQAGQWILPGGTAVDSLAGTVVAVRRVRALWDRTTDPPVIACRSDDGVRGVGTPGGACGECPLAEWHDDAPPACTLSYEYLVVLDGGAPVVVQMSTRSAGSTIGALNLALRVHGHVAVQLRSQLVTRGAKRYYIPVVSFAW